MNQYLGTGEARQNRGFNLIANRMGTAQGLVAIHIQMQLDKLYRSGLTGFQVMQTTHTVNSSNQLL